MHGYVVEQQVNVERKICKTRGVGGGGGISKVYIRFFGYFHLFFQTCIKSKFGRREALILLENQVPKSAILLPN